MKNKFVCLSKNTKVSLRNGLAKNIEDINVNDDICTFNIYKKLIEFSKVKKIVTSFHSLVTTICFSNGVDLTCTLDHPILTEGKGWCSSDPNATFENYNIQASQMNKGDKCLYMSNGKFDIVHVKDIVRTIYNEQMYVISSGVNNNFFANGLIVSDENIMNINFDIFNTKLIEETF